MTNLRLLSSLILFALLSCQNEKPQTEQEEPKIQKIEPVVITDKVPNDSDDPAFYIDPVNPSDSWVLGNDKEAGGGIYVFDLDGKILTDKTLSPVERPNNVDAAIGFSYIGDTTAIAVFTERFTESIRIVKLPEMKYIDGGGIKVFEGEEGEEYRAPMGISIYEDSQSGIIYAIVGRKNGPTTDYLWQYELQAEDSIVTGTVVRKFGSFSGTGEIEALAVDDEMGYVYYSDEAIGIKKYYAHPDSGNQELAVFGRDNFTEDREGIAIWPKDNGKGYILVSDQQNHSFEIFNREGHAANPHDHQRVGEVFLSTIETDGCDLYPDSLSPKFPNGMFVAMSEGGVFHYYDLKEIGDAIEELKNKK